MKNRDLVTGLIYFKLNNIVCMYSVVFFFLRGVFCVM